MLKLQPGFAGCFVVVQESVSNDWAFAQGCRKWDPWDPAGPDKTYLVEQKNISTHVFNRPSVAGAALQTPPLLIYSVTQSAFSSKPSKHHYTQTVKARELEF